MVYGIPEVYGFEVRLTKLETLWVCPIEEPIPRRLLGGQLSLHSSLRAIIACNSNYTSIRSDTYVTWCIFLLFHSGHIWRVRGIKLFLSCWSARAPYASSGVYDVLIFDCIFRSSILFSARWWSSFLFFSAAMHLLKCLDLCLGDGLRMLRILD